jgi:hypothetical protein
MPPMIPTWFYGFDAIMYLVSSLIGFLLSFYFYRMYSLSSEKRHLHMFWGFALLSLGLLSLSATNAFSYINFWQCGPGPFCTLGILGSSFAIESFSYFLYFGLSIIAYAMFMYAYIPKKFRIQNLPNWLIAIYFIFMIVTFQLNEDNIVWFAYIGFFDLTAFLMVGFVTLINIINYSENKTRESLMVVMSFAFLLLFHLLRIFFFINGITYVLAHLSMLTSFLLLLYVITKVKK